MRSEEYRKLLVPFILLISLLTFVSPLKAKNVLFSLPFIENKGQAKPEVSYYLHSHFGFISINKNGTIVYTLIKDNKTTTLQEVFGTVKGEPTSVEEAESEVNLYIGKKENWISGIKTHRIISLGEIYEGIVLNIIAKTKNAEKLFIVKRKTGSGSQKYKCTP